MAFGQWTSIFVWTLGDHSADGSTLLCLLSGNLCGPFAGHVFVCLDLSNLLNAFLGLFWTTRAWACIFLHVLGHISSYTCLGIYLLMDFSMLSRWPCLCTPSLSQSWLPSAASLYPFTLFCRKAAWNKKVKLAMSMSIGYGR